MEIKEQDLVMLRLKNFPHQEGRQRHHNTWFRVMFIDNNGTFIGKVEKIERGEFTLYSIGEDILLSVEKVQHVYQDGEEFCYGDGVTICDCIGLCRNK